MRLPSQIARLARRLPWQLAPWSRVRYLEQLTAQYRSANGQLLRRNEELDRRVSQLHGPLQRDVIGMQAERMFGYESPGTDRLEWVIAAADRGEGRGVRLYASSQLAAVSFRMTEADDPPPRFQLRATFGRTDVIDQPTPQAALAQLARMWAGRDGAPGLLSSPTAPGHRTAAELPSP